MQLVRIILAPPALRALLVMLVMTGIAGAVRLQLAFDNLASLALELVLTLACATALWHSVNVLVRGRRSRVLANATLAALYVVLLATTLTLGHPPDYGVLSDHVNLLLDPSSFTVLAGAVQKRVAFAALAVVVLMAYAQRRWRVLSVGWSDPGVGAAAATLAAFATLIAVAWYGPWRTHDPPSRLLLSALHYYDLPIDAVDAARVAAGANPIESVSTFENPRQVPVFFVLMESHNALWMHQRTESGHVVTPTLNRIADEGVWVEHFYANSIHTSRGLVASLCSVLPSMLHPITREADIRLHCLPEVVRNAGYQTYFFHNSASLGRENMASFLRETGIDHAFALDDGLADPERDADALWGFDTTLQDDLFFERVFDRLDADRRAEGANGDAPLFVGLTTGSHHMWFDWVPERELGFAPTPGDRRELFAASLQASDRYLERLFEELGKRPWTRDALVVLTGDHGYPSGERGNFVSATGAHEENFRTPLVLWSPGWLGPRRISGVAHSQVDLMPTVLDMLGIDVEAPMAGRSIFGTERAPVLLVQPYDGRQLVSIRYPYKLIRRLDVGSEQLFHLGNDPGEQQDLLAGPNRAQYAEIVDELGPPLRAFFENQLRIRLNALVPYP